MSLPLAVPLSASQDVGMPEKPTRRSFKTEYKLKIIAAADACTAPGEIGTLLRREGLYSSHLNAWRRALKAGNLSGAAPRRGPKPKSSNQSEVKALKRRLARAEARANRAEAIVELQKKVATLFGDTLPEIDELP